VFDQSPVGLYAGASRRRGRLGLEVTEPRVASLAESADDLLTRLRGGNPDVLVYLGLGVSSRAVALAREALGWNVPVLANSALMFGYARPDWRDGYAGWEYIDTVSDDNRQRASLKELSPHAAAGRSGARPTTWGGCSERRSPRPTISPGPGSPTGCDG
jgi:hypothetical protein